MWCYLKTNITNLIVSLIFCYSLIIKLAFRHCNLDLIGLHLLNTDLRQNQHWNVFGVECAEQKNASATPTSWWSNPKRPAVSRRPFESVQSKTIHGKTKNRQLSTIFASYLLKLYIWANWSCLFLKGYFGSTPVTGLFICSKGNLKPSLPHVLGCFSSFAWILHVVGEKVRALPRPEGAMDKYTSDKVTETRILENSR